MMANVKLYNSTGVYWVNTTTSAGTTITTNQVYTPNYTFTYDLPVKYTVQKIKFPDYLPFYTENDAPEWFQRSEIKYESVPINEFPGIKDKPLYPLLKTLVEVMPKGTYIAGGFMRALLNSESKTEDIDLFFNGSESFSKMADILNGVNEQKMPGEYMPKENLTEVKSYSNQYRVVNFITPDPKMPPIQLIKLVWHDSPEHVIDLFDFTITQFATDGERIYYSKQALEDLITKRIRLHKVRSPIVVLNRLLKYERKGYSASPIEFKDVADRAANLMLTSAPDKLGEYFYLPPGEEEERKVPVKWVKEAWKYLIASDNGKVLCQKVFNSRARVRRSLDVISASVEKRMKVL